MLAYTIKKGLPHFTWYEETAKHISKQALGGSKNQQNVFGGFA